LKIPELLKSLDELKQKYSLNKKNIDEVVNKKVVGSTTIPPLIIPSKKELRSITMLFNKFGKHLLSEEFDTLKQYDKIVILIHTLSQGFDKLSSLPENMNVSEFCYLCHKLFELDFILKWCEKKKRGNLSYVLNEISDGNVKIDISDKDLYLKQVEDFFTGVISNPFKDKFLKNELAGILRLPVVCNNFYFSNQESLDSYQCDYILNRYLLIKDQFLLGIPDDLKGYEDIFNKIWSTFKLFLVKGGNNEFDSLSKFEISDSYINIDNYNYCLLFPNSRMPKILNWGIFNE